MDDTKKCTKCKVIKNKSLFRKRAATKDGLHSHCNQCRDAYAAANYHRYREINKFLHLKRKYNITKEQYCQIQKQQHNLCAICHKPESRVIKGNKDLSIDHDHKTGKVRGMLCHHCNAGLGLLNDDVSLIKKTIKYLQENS